MHHEVIINLQQLAFNAAYLQKVMAPARLCAVLKNNAYGHGLIRCAKIIATTGVKDLGVVDNHEIEQIRESDDPLLKEVNLWRVRPSLPWEHDEAIRKGWNVIEQVGSLDDLDWAIDAPITQKYVLMLDCSIGRAGFGVPSHTDDLLSAAQSLGAARIAGVMTHLANADGNETALQHTIQELDDFDAAIGCIKKVIGKECFTSVGNSAAGLRLERVRNQYNMIRCGAGIFGETTSPLVEKPAKLTPCFTWRTWIAQVRFIPVGARIGYGSKYLVTQEEQVATLPIGYADGLKKSLGNGCGEVLVRGVRCPIRGSISSAITVIGVSHVPGPPLKPGEEVVIIGKQQDAYQAPDDLANLAGTGHLDIQAGIRAPISYVK